MNSELVIVQSANDCNRLKKYKNTDFLVFTPEVMQKMDLYGISYKTIEDFYSSKDYVEDIKVFNGTLESLLYELDDVCTSCVDFSYSYSGNAIYFFTWLDDVFYLDHLIKKIGQKYSKTFVYNVYKPKKPLSSSNILSYAELVSDVSNGTVSFPLERGVDRSIGIMFNVLKMEFIADRKTPPNLIGLLFKFNSFYGRLRAKLKGLYQEFKKSVLTNKSKGVKKSEVIYVVQDGYEVKPLKQFLTDYDYKSSTSSLRYDLSSKTPHEVKLEAVDHILDDFISQEFFFLNKNVELIFKSYHKEVVGRVDLFKDAAQNEIAKLKPRTMLFSMGIRDVFDMIMARTANALEIPVVFFQHGGTLVFQVPLCQKYIELNSNIKKHLIINANRELKIVQHLGSSVVPLGSIYRFDVINGETVKQTKEILFSAEPYECTVYRGLIDGLSCHNSYKTSGDIVSTISNNQLAVDIKIHPSGQEESYGYYHQLSKKYKNTKIITGYPVEAIFKKYKLIVLTYTGSATLPTFLAYNVPVILFIERFDDLVIDDVSKQALINRCYVVKDRIELRDVLVRYKYQGLPSKWSKDFVDQYVYPVDKGNPGINIANYIRAL